MMQNDEKQRDQNARRHEINVETTQHEREKPRTLANKHSTMIGVWIKMPTTAAYKK
jgi:hypothetical protein